MVEEAAVVHGRNAAGSHWIVAGEVRPEIWGGCEGLGVVVALACHNLFCII